MIIMSWFLNRKDDFIRKSNKVFARRKLSTAGFLIFVLSNISSAYAQQNDFGVWGSIAVTHKFSRRLSASVEEQFRFNQNASNLVQYFSDAGLEYSISKKFKVAICYRFINSYQYTYYSKRHRLYADLSYKTKISLLQLLLRTRLQEQQQDIFSSEHGRIPAWYSRNKITAKIDLNKKYAPYLSAELFYMLSAPNEDGGLIDKMRYAAGVQYEFNRVHAVDFYYMIQQDKNVNDPVTDFVVGLGYVFSF